MKSKIKIKSIARVIFLTGLLLALLVLLAVPKESTAKQSPNLKVIAQRNLFEEREEDIVLWHDYGSYALYRVTKEAWQLLPDDIRTQAQILDDSNVLLMDAKAMVSPINAERQKELAEAYQGKSLHLIQFVGPIKGAWLSSVEAAGADLVHYIANFGYLVWTDDVGRHKLDMLTRQGDFLQRSAPYLPAYKLGPTLNSEAAESGDESLVQVTVQLYRHEQVKISERLVEDLFLDTSGPWEYVLNYQNLTGYLRQDDVQLISELPDVVWVGESFPRELNDEVQGQIMANNLIADQSKPTGPGYLDWLSDLGLSKNPNDYPIVDITDDGIGNGNAADAGGDVTLRELGNGTKPSRLAYIANCTSEPNGAGPDGHGHLNVSIAGGYDMRTGFPFEDERDYQRGLGINPYGRFAGTRVFDQGFNTVNCGGNDSSLIKETYKRGARIVSNSWGCRLCAGVYDASSQAYDAGVRDADPTTEGNQQFVILFSSGNYGPDPDTIGTPGNGKNVITVGASENVRPTWTDGCGITPGLSNSVHDIAPFSSRGPAPGGRIKPDLVTPGTHIQGTASTSPDYNGTGVCDQFHPGEQTVFAASSGTSHSVPAVAGYASLAYAYLQQNYGVTTPSPALLKGYIVAHTMYLDGIGSGGDLPSHNQGYGLTDMTAAFDTTSRVVFDQTDTKLFNESGETWSVTLSAVDSSKPVRVVMAFTDQPGATGRDPQVNDLNLAVQADGMTYLGNQMSGQWSVTGGSPDPVNTVEAVYLPALNDSTVQIEVTAFNIAGDGVPGNGDVTDQDFALVCSNCIQQEDFILTVNPVENGLCRPGNAVYGLDLVSILDFSQPVSLNVTGLPAGISSQFSKNPVTPTDASALTLSADDTAEPGDYVLTVNGNSTDRHHSARIKLALFSEKPDSPQLEAPVDGASNLPTGVQFSWTAVAQAATYEIQIATDSDFEQIIEEASGLVEPSFTAKELLPGQVYYWRTRAVNSCDTSAYSSSNAFSTKPLPGGCPVGSVPEVIYFTNFENSAGDWTGQGIQNTWTLSDIRSHSAATSFYAEDLNELSDQQLLSPSINLPADSGLLTLQFWNYQSIENSELEEEVCFDAGILEISTNNGQSWQQVGNDIQDNSILVTDPYKGIVSSDHENPLSGRPGWCGDPQNWLNSVVRIDGYAGKTVRFRFRLGSDLSIGSDLGHEGWYIDDVLVQACPVSFGNNFLPTILKGNK